MSTHSHSREDTGIEPNQHSQLLTDSSPLPVLIHEAGICRYLNQKCVRLLGGTSASDFIGMPVLSLIHADYHAGALERIHRILQGESEVEPIELQLRRKDGSVAWVETAGVSVQFAGKPAIYVMGRDINDRKLLEARENQRLRELQALYTLSSAASAATTADQVYEAAMNAILDLLKADRAAVLLMGKDKRMHFQASRGLSLAYRNAVDGHCPWPPDVVDPKQVFVDDIEQQPDMTHLLPAARTEGLRGFGFVPLVHQGRLVGKFMVYFNAPHVCTENDVRLAKTIAVHIALAMGRAVTDHELRVAATAFETQEGIVVTDADNVILKVNAAFTAITGYTSAEVVGLSPAVLQSGRHDRVFYHAMWRDLQVNGCWEGDIWNRRKDGTVYLEHLAITAVPDAFDKVANYVATFTDITHQKEAQDEIYSLAFYDPLTHLANRRLLLDRLNQSLLSSERHAIFGAVIYVDLDHFKSLNDSKGHIVGDQMLVQVAHRLKECVRDFDTVSRLGSDEFAIAIEALGRHADEAAHQAKTVALKIRAALSAFYLLNHEKYHSTPSIGIALYKGQNASASDLIKHADIAMRQAKTAGRNTIRFFDASMQTTLESRVKLETGLRQAIEDQQFVLHYQIQVDGRQQITGVEALIRWMHPTRGIVSPCEFIGLAEETGHILPIGNWVLQTACEQIKAWSLHPSTRHLRMSVNVSAKQLAQDNFVNDIQAALNDTGIDATSLKLELTESLMLRDVDKTIVKMQQIRALGVELSLDDFGTGFSSLSLLKKLPLNQLKIDQSFVRDLVTNSHDKAIVKSIISLGDALNLHVIAEGVETAEQQHALEQLGCHNFQGYWFGKPEPVEVVNQIIAERVLTLPRCKTVAT